MAGKKSFTISCPTVFRKRVEALAQSRHVNVADIARSVILTVPEEIIRRAADPGEPESGDREEVVLRSGPSAGRVLKRKPRLQLRMPPDTDGSLIRRALALALAQDDGAATPSGGNGAFPDKDKLVEVLRDENERLVTLLSVLSFDPLPQGPKTRSDALHILGFPPDATPDSRALVAKFKMLAAYHHPDSGYGSHQRMIQLNLAMELLKSEDRRRRA